MEGYHYHDEASGDRVVAAVAQLPKFGPVVLLAKEPSIFFIIPVGQRCAALTTPGKEIKKAVKLLTYTFKKAFKFIFLCSL